MGSGEWGGEGMCVGGGGWGGPFSVSQRFTSVWEVRLVDFDRFRPSVSGFGRKVLSLLALWQREF